ncbi:MAG: 50S ribosomal protein L24 [Candidatus Heimdallarchaeaceae archaeon]
MKVKTASPRRQRKRFFNAPLHRRKRGMVARLSYELQEKYGVKRMPVVRGDKVVVFRAIREEDEIKGKVIKCLPQKYAIHIEGHSKEKADGTIKSFPVKPSNVIITGLNLKDKKRRELLKRKSVKELTDEELEESIFEEEEEEELEAEEETLEEDFDIDEDFEDELEDELSDEEDDEK